MPSNATLLMDVLSSNPPATRTRHNRKHQASQYTPQHRNTHQNDDTYSIADEGEEVIFELDEAALSKLPLHLQNNMREIQAERVHRLQKEHKQNLHRRVRKYGDSNGSVSEIYAEKWYQNMLAKVAATRELEARTMNEADHGIARPVGISWCPVRHEWAPKSVSSGVSRGRGRAMPMPVSVPSDTCVAGLRDASGFPRGCLPCAETCASRGYYVASCKGRRESSYSSYMPWRCAGPYSVYEARAEEKFWKREGRFSHNSRKKCISYISDVCDRIRMRFQRAKRGLSK
ncbi:hypothetical protein BJY01DRAFT_204704 [Aspergillus pseudoustus]|uniref:Uncharacterized protein n=1 Tax=Aspergillus pseudoustus TaxID=1810923 RepID=A0ABR4KRS4_9EURO